ncbi:hypothetical protein [Flavobacterium channae]|uniref:hypothetical protein n=1 Tax=Flavobacterium channae TaxID=2897181 RepID=UPI001E570407|nr:hypothetical protein [Flavobacterium channae]UGS23953.1 hypothetical protein LOS89_01455 [Flavobacterium channae]
MNTTKKMRVNEIIKEYYPVFETEKEINIDNEAELTDLLLQLEEGYEKMVDEYLKKYDKQLKRFIHLEAPQSTKAKTDLQDKFVIDNLRKSLLAHKKPSKELIYNYLWAFKRNNTDTSHYYD